MAKAGIFVSLTGIPAFLTGENAEEFGKNWQIFATKSLKKIVQPKAVGYNKKRTDLV